MTAAKGLKATEWVDQVKAVISGVKGGGRDDTAQGSGKGINLVRLRTTACLIMAYSLQVAAAAEAARNFAVAKLQ